MINVNIINNKNTENKEKTLFFKDKSASGVKDILSLMPTSPTKEDKELIIRACKYAEKVHEGNIRYSGEPYINHTIETAKTLAEIGMGPKTVAAGLLHDIIEDTNQTEEDLEREFGKEILFLVKGVTKLGRLRYQGVERHVGSLQKLFVATSQDLRVLIIKLADRLHNMETLEYVPLKKQKRIALETLEIYAPLAYRLGVRKIHRGLEDLAFKFVYPKEYEETQQLLKREAKETVKKLEKTNRSIRKALAKENLTKIKTECRMKGLYSLYKKLQRKDKDIEKVYDIAAIRIIVPTVSDCYKALGIIHGTWQPLPNRIHDYIAFPKPNGYQSIHTTIFTGDGSIVEIQIRTQKMHREAEYGIASHISFKEGFKKRMLNPNLLWIRQLLPAGYIAPSQNNTNTSPIDVPKWIKQLAETHKNFAEPQEFIKNLKTDFFEHRIFVFTPKGDVVDLPINSSPLDFAYAIHSDLGDHTSGAKVNGKFVSLDTELKNGNIIEIETKKSSHPTQKWLDFSKTTLARRHIKSALQKTSDV